MRRPCDRSEPLDRIAGRDLHLGAQRPLALEDVLGDVLRQLLHEQLLAHHDLVDRLLEELGEAGHVHALLSRVEIDEAVDLARDERLLPVAHPHGLLDARHARAGEAETHLRRRGLEVLVESSVWVHPATLATRETRAG